MMTTTEMVPTLRLNEHLAVDGWSALKSLTQGEVRAVVAEALSTRLNAHHEVHRCFICDQPFLPGEMVLSDVNEGLGHRACFGEDREGYVKDLDTGEPLAPDDPIPAGEQYDPADFPEFARNAQSEAAAVKALLNIRELNMAGADENGHRWANSDLVEQEIVFALTHPAPPLAVTHAARDVLAERRRQIEAEGWTPEHDDKHDKAEIARAAASYVLQYVSSQTWFALSSQARGVIGWLWPWDAEWFKPSGGRRDLVKAAALLLAEIERLDRKEALNVTPLFSSLSVGGGE